MLPLVIFYSYLKKQAMKFFIDTANLDQIREANELGVLDGVTTNPGDLSWGGMKKLGDFTVYDRTSPDQIIERA